MEIEAEKKTWDKERSSWSSENRLVKKMEERRDSS